ncbi:hypothetical protein PSI22_21260 [Xenorhabdus sp. XENO-7]|uniref:Uncharacterized protein n=1 Tax=Xenorhabdus aichiensis TaxID=3025874 RepID=A0ABT5MAR6_9GAMM|nr:hypothetical protein [Xenorhabdus aichiensis]MDC9624085.1 hypothetical protein [Xenorhabdus aichiensis]
MSKMPDFFKPLHEQPEIVIPELWKHKDVIDEVLPFYLAVLAKTSKNPEKFFKYNMQSLDKIFGHDKTKRGPRDNEIADYAYYLNARTRDIFDKLDDF